MIWSSHPCREQNPFLERLRIMWKMCDRYMRWVKRVLRSTSTNVYFGRSYGHFAFGLPANCVFTNKSRGLPHKYICFYMFLPWKYQFGGYMYISHFQTHMTSTYLRSVGRIGTHDIRLNCQASRSAHEQRWRGNIVLLTCFDSHICFIARFCLDSDNCRACSAWAFPPQGWQRTFLSLVVT
jgi:hypothetical protein